MFPCIPFPPLSRIKRFTRFSLNSESRHFQFRFSLLSLAPSFSPRESRMDSPLLNFVCEREIASPDPTFFLRSGLDRTKGTETGYEGNQRVWRKERERGRENPSARATAWRRCRLPLADFHPPTSKRAKFRCTLCATAIFFFFFFPFFVSREQRRQ